MNIKEAEKLYFECKFDEAFTEFQRLANDGVARAFYFLGEFYSFSFGQKEDKSLA